MDFALVRARHNEVVKSNKSTLRKITENILQISLIRSCRAYMGGGSFPANPY